MLRFIYFLLLLILLLGIGVFAMQNSEPVTLKYLDQSTSCPKSALIGVVYFLGMVSGWTVVGFLNRSLRRVAERQRG